MKKTFLTCLFMLMFIALPTLAQEIPAAQGQSSASSVSVAPSAIDAYNQWRDGTLVKFQNGLNSQYYCLAVVSQKLDANTARIEYALAADMNKYTLEIKPVKLTVSPNGDVQQVDAGKTVVIDRKPGKDNNPKRQVDQSVYIVNVDKTANAIELTWTPTTGNSKVANTCIVLLKDTPTVLANGFIEGLPLK
jgi:hypothetical protein